MLKYQIEPTIGKYTRNWFNLQLKLYDKDIDDFGVESRRVVREIYEVLKKQLPRDVCSFLFSFVHKWCTGTEEVGLQKPQDKEIRMYLTLANGCQFNQGNFSHFIIIERLEEVYKFMVDNGDENIPDITADMGTKERVKVRNKYIRRYLREHPEIKEHYKQLLNEESY